MAVASNDATASSLECVEADKPKTAKCADCRDTNPLDECQPKGRNSVICNFCNRLSSRLRRLPSCTVCELKELSPQEMKKWRKTAHNMFGDELSKSVHEAYLLHKIKKASTTKSQKGETVPYETLEKEYAETQSKTWRNILENGKRIVHPVTKKEHIWMPSIHIDITEHEETSESRKRLVGSETTTKKAKAPRTNKQNIKNKKEGKDGDEETGVEMAKINPAALEKLKKKVVAGQEVKFSLTTLYVQVQNSEDMMGAIAPNKVKEMKEAAAELTKSLESAEAAASAGSCAKKGLPPINKSLTTNIARSKTVLKDVSATLKAEGLNQE